MRKSKKQLAIAVAACAMIGVMAIGGTMAYLTDMESTTNTFTIGKVKIALKEPNYPGNESDQAKDLVPNEVVKKDPQVQNTGINDAIIYLKVEVPKANVTVVEDGGARGDKKVQEIFTLKNLKTGDDGTWMEIRKDDSAADKCVYVYAYKTKLAKDATTTPLFDEVQLKNVIEQEIDTTTQNIKINAYAIQADNILDVDTTTLDQVKLGKVYDIYVNQSGDKDKQADSGNQNDQKSGTAVLLNGFEINAKMKSMAGNSSTGQYNADSTITAIQQSKTKPSESVKTDANAVISTTDSEKPVYMWFEDGTIKWWSEAKTVKAGTNLSYLCSEITNISDISGLANWDTGAVTNMGRIFHDCNSLTDLNPLSKWNIENVTNMSDMFYGCTNLTDLSTLSTWNVSNVTNMQGMFGSINDRSPMALVDLSPLSDWNTSNVTNMSSMFAFCAVSDLSSLSNWNTGNVTKMSRMFDGCYRLKNLNGLATWDTGNVTNINNMFSECRGLTNLDALANWDVSNVTDMSQMFYSKEYRNGIKITDLGPLATWNTEKVTNMEEMFYGCNKLTDASAINNWNIENVTDFSYMFNSCPSYPTFTKRAGTWNSSGTFTPTT